RITMKPNTALATLALGVAVRSLASRSLGPRRQLGRIAAYFALALARSALLEHAFGGDLGIAQLLLSDPWTNLAEAVPGRPSLPTAAGLTLLSSAVLLADAMLRRPLVPGIASAAGSLRRR